MSDKSPSRFLKKIDQTRPNAGQSELFGKTNFGGMRNIDIARLNSGMEIKEGDPLEDGEVGFSTRLLVQATLPHSRPPKDKELWVRKNGFASLAVQSGFDIDPNTGEKNLVGLPYGTIPRLIMIYLCSEAIRLKSPEISLGDNLSDFMAELGLNRTGGKRGDITRLKEQAEKLVRSRIQYLYNDGKGNAGMDASIAEEWAFFWDTTPEQSSLFESKIILSNRFYQEIVKNPVPLHLGVIAALKGSPFDLDLYTWLTYRVARLEKSIFIRWADLEQQLGASYSNRKDFIKNAKKHLEQIKDVWVGLDYDKGRGGFMLNPCEPSVPKLR